MNTDPMQVARLISANPTGPENLGSPSAIENEGSQRGGKKKANDCAMAPISNSQNGSCFKNRRSLGRRAFEVFTGRRPFTKNRHGVTPTAYVTINIVPARSRGWITHQNDCPHPQGDAEPVRIQEPLQEEWHNDSSRACAGPHHTIRLSLELMMFS